MALGMSLLGCLILACALNFANAQPLPESVYRQLTAAELRDISLMQSPELLDLAARTGESVRVIISDEQQGAIVQESVNTILDCTEFAKRFPGGEVRWYLYAFTDLSHTDLDLRQFQDPAIVNSATSPRVRIYGEFNQIYEIIRALIAMDAEDSSRGVYECEVCIAKGNPIFEQCHSANTTIATAGRPPIIDEGSGRESDEMNGYNIGQTVCLFIHPTDPRLNRPQNFITLRCSDVGAVSDEFGNPMIPSPIPSSTFTWEHTSLDGVTANFAFNSSQMELTTSYIPPMEFTDAFPLLSMTEILGVSTMADTRAVTLLFSITNITSFNNSEYLALREAFGEWKCRLDNDLGMDMATTIITDMCGDVVPTILVDCSALGDDLDNAYIVDDTLNAQITVGCDLCVSGSSIALTLSCPTNIASFNLIITKREWTKDGVVLSEAEDLTVLEPGDYTCKVYFEDAGEDSATSSVRFTPDVEIVYTRGNSTTSGCERLRYDDYPVEPNDVCVFFNEIEMTSAEPLIIECLTDQPNVTASPVYEDGGLNASRVLIRNREQDNTVVVCDIESSNEDVDERCSRVASLNINIFEPAEILIDFENVCTISAGEIYAPTFVTQSQLVLCCLVIGYPEPNVTWSRIVLDPSGVAREIVITGNDTRYTIGEDNRLRILNYTQVFDGGTYVCRAENIAGVDVASVSLTVRSVPLFQVSEWSECKPNCVDGVRTRSAWCEVDGVVVADTMCCNNDGIDDVKPHTSELCTNVPGLDGCFLTPLWKTGEFSACSRGCAGGVRYREVYCALPLDGTRVHDERCIELYGAENKPTQYDICYNRCCLTDVYPTFCRSAGTYHCDNPVYQQNCCWTCGLDQFE